MKSPIVNDDKSEIKKETNDMDGKSSSEISTIEEVKVNYEEIIATNEVTIEHVDGLDQSLSPSKTLTSPLSVSASGGICSVLLEVIEKLRDEETDVTNSTKRKKKVGKKSETGAKIKSIKKEIDSQQKSKRGRKRKVNELISEKEDKEKSKVQQEKSKIVNIKNNN